MDRDQLRSILNEVAERTRSIDEALAALRDLPYEDATAAVIDHHRALRTGVPEVIYGASKTPAQIAAIVERMVARNGRAIVTRASREAVEAVRAKYPEMQGL